MSKIGLLFPGQGSQYVGMGKELYDKYKEARNIFDEANQILGFDLKKIIFEGPEDDLRQTKYTQAAIFVTTLAIYKIFTMNYKLNTQDCFGAGHSLGEYSCLAASEVFGLKDGLNLVKARGEFIQKASDKNPGTMAAIIGLESEKIKDICNQVKDGEVCEMVNFNSPGQIVIAGNNNAINKAAAMAKEKGAMKAIILNVSGPFHSSLMEEASKMMGEELEKYNFNEAKFPVIANCDAQISNDKNKIRDNLVKQINSPVLWEDTIRKMIDNGVEIFLEIGPQRVLSGLMRRIDKRKKSLNIEDQESLEKTLESLNSGGVA